MFWFYVLPLGFLLTQYTITGYDASAHISEETHGAAMSAAKGVWRSVFYSAVIGWIVLLAITFAATDVGAINEGAPASASAPRSRSSPRRSAPAGFKAVLIISTVGQLFCGGACLTSASRMCYAFSRDRGFGHGSRRPLAGQPKRVPLYAVHGDGGHRRCSSRCRR